MTEEISHQATKYSFDQLEKKNIKREKSKELLLVS